MMTVDTLIECLKEDMEILDKEHEDYCRKATEAFEAGDNNSAAYWEDRSNEAWRRGMNIRNALRVIKERLGG